MQMKFAFKFNFNFKLGSKLDFRWIRWYQL